MNEDFLIRLKSTRGISDLERSQIFDQFKQWGFVVIECEPCASFKDNLLYLSHFFGSVIRHNQSDRDGILPITPMENLPEYANTTSKDLALHTDGSFEAIPPKVMAMQCETAAMTGGLTLLASAQAAYEQLADRNPEGLAALSQPEAFKITRANQSATRAVFVNHGGRIYTAFRSDQAAQISVHPQALAAFNQLKAFFANPAHQVAFKLQPHQILVFDNTRVLHGRTGFPKHEARRIHGIWFDGCSAYADELHFGFKPAIASLAMI